VDIHRIYGRVGRRFRLARMRRLVHEFALTDQTSVLDVGGTPQNWELVDVRPRVTLLNLGPSVDEASLPPHVRYVVGDGRDLPYGDGEFDLVVSNSVIEHVGNAADQARFAAEIRRVGRGVWVQAPAYEFPVEPHYLTPFVHWLPASVQRRVLRWSVWGLITRPDRTFVDRLVDEIRLPNRRRMRVYFPDCELRAERVLGLTKAHVAIRLPIDP
jgi:hypothetical protein